MPHLDQTLIGLTGGGQRIDSQRIGQLSQSAQGGLGQIARSQKQSSFDEFLAGGVANLEKLADEIGFPQEGRDMFRNAVQDKASMQKMSFLLMKFAEENKVSLGAQAGLKRVQEEKERLQREQLKQFSPDATEEDRAAVTAKNEEIIRGIVRTEFTPKEFQAAEGQLTFGAGIGRSSRDKVREDREKRLAGRTEILNKEAELKRLDRVFKLMDLDKFSDIYATFAQTKEDIDQTFDTIQKFEQESFLGSLGITASKIWKWTPNQAAQFGKKHGKKKEVEAVIDFIATKQRFLADFIKAISGAQSSDREVVRLSDAVGAAVGLSMEDFIRNFNKQVKKIVKRMRFKENAVTNIDKEAVLKIFGESDLPSDLMKKAMIRLDEEQRRIEEAQADIPSVRGKLDEEKKRIKLETDQEIIDEIMSTEAGKLARELLIQAGPDDTELVKEFDEFFGVGKAEIIFDNLDSSGL